ncbi:MAG: hypothetical protein JWM52_821 [Candidatus Saccharibacteria bacterium]|nr:hypothetical protein [Candidatus Saccharibacteria bacterium]
MKRLAHYSQYFLRSPDFIKELIGHTSIKPNDVVYDIGAGSGAISAVLAGKVKRVEAIEFEPRMAGKLRENMERYPNVFVTETDFLELKLPSTPYKIFANIPFHLSSPIVHKITEDPHPPVAAYLIVQKQFANKLLPNSDRFTGQLGMMIGPTFGVRIRRPLKRSDYFPHPNVDTALIEIKKRDEPFIPLDKMPAYRKFIEGCFSDPKIFAKAPREEIGLPEGIKPSEMRLHQWVELFHHV